VLDRWYHALETGGVAAEAIVRTESADVIMQVEVGLQEEQSECWSMSRMSRAVTGVVVQVGEGGNTGLTSLSDTVA
jgi:hypothetical protein